MRCALVALLLAGCSRASPPAKPLDWPPRIDQPYPDLELVDQTGAVLKLSSFKGKVILVEPIGMTCAGCQAFAGAHARGGFGGVAPQPGLASIEELLPRFAGVPLSDDRLVYVQLLLYSLSMQAPTPDDARRWAAHFGMDRAKNRIVLTGTAAMLGPASHDLIPGFQLVDRGFVLRSDSTGHQPRHDLYRHLLPMVPKLLAQP